MTLRASAVLTFISYVVNPSQPGATPAVPVTVTLNFSCADPGANQGPAYSVTVTEAELATASTAPLLRQLVIDKLTLQFKPSVAAAIITRLDGLVGQTVTV